MFLPHSSWSIVFVFVVSSFLAIHTSTTRDRRGTGTSQTMSKGTSLHQSAVAAVIVLQLAPNVPVFLINHWIECESQWYQTLAKNVVSLQSLLHMTQVHYQYSDRYLLWIASKFEIKKNMINWHQSLPSYIGMHSWQIKCVAFSVTVSLADAEVESVPELDIQQAAPPCFSSKHTTHCPESRSCLNRLSFRWVVIWEDFLGSLVVSLASFLATRYILNFTSII